MHEGGKQGPPGSEGAGHEPSRKNRGGLPEGNLDSQPRADPSGVLGW